MSFKQWMDDFDPEVSLRWFATPEIIHNHVMDRATAESIERAANLAFTGRFGEAEQARMKAGYAGLGLIDSGPIARESESTREAFRRGLDDDAHE